MTKVTLKKNMFWPLSHTIHAHARMDAHGLEESPIAMWKALKMFQMNACENIFLTLEYATHFKTKHEDTYHK